MFTAAGLSNAAFPRHEHPALLDQHEPCRCQQARESDCAAGSRRWGIVGAGAPRILRSGDAGHTPHPLSHDSAVGLLAAWTRFKVQEITLSILTSALEIKAAHGFSYYDSAIIAAARALGCRELYSEDMSHGREIEGVVIVNSFR